MGDQPKAYRPPARRDDGERRRDDRGGYDRRDDRRDDRGSYDRRDDRGGYDRRDDRGGYGRREDSDRDYDRNSIRGSAEKEERKKTPEPPMKKYEEPKPANVVAPNKFAFLQEEEVEGG